MTPPWRQPSTVEDAIDLACDVRDIDPHDVAARVVTWPLDRTINTLIAVAALVDIDRPLDALLGWASQTAKPGPKRRISPTCRRGHPRNAENTKLDVNGTTLRCRVCDRENRARLRAERRAA